MVCAYQVPDDSLVADNQLVHYVAIDPDWQTSYAVDIPLCANIVDKSVSWCTDDAVKIDDMLAQVMLLHVSQSHNSCRVLKFKFSLYDPHLFRFFNVN